MHDEVMKLISDIIKHNEETPDIYDFISSYTPNTNTAYPVKKFVYEEYIRDYMRSKSELFHDLFYPHISS